MKFFCFVLQWVASIDISANEEADANVLAKICDSFCEHAEQVCIDVEMRTLMDKISHRSVLGKRKRSHGYKQKDRWVSHLHSKSACVICKPSENCLCFVFIQM